MQYSLGHPVEPLALGGAIVKKLVSFSLALILTLATSVAGRALDETILRIPLTSQVTLLISTTAKCEPVKPGASYACQINAKAEAPWTGGGEHAVYSDTGERIGFLSVFSDGNADGTRKARISLNSIPATLKIRIASDQNLLTVIPPEVLTVMPFSFSKYKWPSTVKSYTSVRVYASIFGNRSAKASLLIGVPKTIQMSKKATCASVTIPVAYLDENSEAVFPRKHSFTKYLELKLSVWKGSTQLSATEFGQGKIPWSSEQITGIPMKFCGINSKAKSKTTFKFESWAAFHFIDDSSVTETVNITFVQK
jgi:hypothetical protein